MLASLMLCWLLLYAMLASALCYTGFCSTYAGFRSTYAGFRSTVCWLPTYAGFPIVKLAYTLECLCLSHERSKCRAKGTDIHLSMLQQGWSAKESKIPYLEVGKLLLQWRPPASARNTKVKMTPWWMKKPKMSSVTMPRSPSPIADPSPEPMTMDMDVGHSYEDEDTPQVTEPHTNQWEVELDLDRDLIISSYPRGMAGTVHLKAKLSKNERYAMEIGSQSQGNVCTPFMLSLDWEVARWAKIHSPSSTSFMELMAIKGCTRTLFRNPDFAPHLLFAPKRHYADEEKSERMYHDMNTGSWWWKMQAVVEKDKPGATIVPVLVSTDKTQLTTFRNKTAYPIYMTIGNIPKIIQWKMSLSAYLLLGYLPTAKLEQETNKAKRKWLIANLYHACMWHILEPLISAGKNGVFMSTAASDVYRTHPIFASFIGNYPKQVLTTCMLTGNCPRCGTTNDDLGDFGPGDVHEARSLDEALLVLNSFHLDPVHFLQASSQICMKPVPHPFWLDLPHSNIYWSITPNVLHQLYQGIFKHLKTWILSACDPAEIDAQCRRLFPNHHICLFMKGISSLSHSLTRFHANNGIFINLGIRKHFNLPKLHFMSHYVELIRDFGTTDNFNTQYTERLHIDLMKDAYAATNHKDKGMQMTTWLDQRERVGKTPDTSDNGA
ncbi:hypothetical protein EI94DRAFT_1707758 [Lactarius quietus]|nr:hypothetical protein EI94DRAFT_1707758 [Lactarius quietus]